MAEIMSKHFKLVFTRENMGHGDEGREVKSPTMRGNNSNMRRNNGSGNYMAQMELQTGH